MIFDIIQGIATMILPMTLVIALLLYGSDIYRNGVKPLYVQLKAVICFLLTFAITISAMIIMVFNIYWVAIALNEAEVVSYMAREFMFTCVTFLWNIIGAVLIFNIWKHIYYTNHNIINDLKEDLKRIKERKSYGRYENTN